MLDRQCSIWSVDTGNFYNSRETRLHLLNHRLKVEKNNLVNGRSFKTKSGKKRITLGLADIDKKLSEDISSTERIELEDKREKIRSLIEHKNKRIKETKQKLLVLLGNKVKANEYSKGRHHIRELNDNGVAKKRIISVFESFLTRTIGVKTDELSEDFMVVQTFYFDILKDILLFGFKYKGEKYIYFTSSAGQIRTKKCVFIKESVWNKYEKTLMCGLTIDKINKKGGINTN